MAKRTTEKTEEIQEVKKGYTAPGYTVPKGEEETVAALIEVITFDFGERTSKARTYKTSPRGWDLFVSNHATGGWTILKVLHLPEGAQEFDPMEYYKYDPKIIRAINDVV